MDEKILEGFKKLGIQVKNEKVECGMSSKMQINYQKCSIYKKTNLYYSGKTIAKN